MNVAEACYDLAEHYGADEKRSYLAGMLHDIMKEDLPERQKQFTVDSGLSPDPAEVNTLRCGTPLQADITSAKSLR